MIYNFNENQVNVKIFNVGNEIKTTFIPLCLICTRKLFSSDPVTYMQVTG